MVNPVTELKSSIARNLAEKINAKEFRVGVVGLGYVGLPLGLAFAHQGVTTIGYDIDPGKVQRLRQGGSYLSTIPADRVLPCVENGRFDPTNDIEHLAAADAIVICVPTPLNTYREPDLSYVEKTIQAVAPYLRKGHVISLESTTYPGTTQEIICAEVEKTDLKIGEDVFIVYSPEREDPGNVSFDISSTPKVVGGSDPDSLALGQMIYGQINDQIVPVSSLETAEAVKITENIFRAVNIALVNELKVIFTKMDINIWEVIDAAKTKPFGYMPFYPGPGLGGHCIPIDPFYLAWKVREFGFTTRFIELAGEINTAMPDYVMRRLSEALNTQSGAGLKGRKVLVVGVAYKKNVGDIRESPSLKIMEMLLEQGAAVDYVDPFVPEIDETRKHGTLAGMRSIDANGIKNTGYDVAIICTDHDQFDYEAIVEHVGLVIDTRNATKALQSGHENIVMA